MAAVARRAQESKEEDEMKLYRWSQNPTSDSKSHKKMMMRRATTKAITKYGIGGAKKTIGAPKSITLPKLKFMENGDGEG